MADETKTSEEVQEKSDENRGLPHRRWEEHEKGTVGENTLADDAPSPVAGAHIDNWDIVPGTSIEDVFPDVTPGTQAEPQAVTSFPLPSDSTDKEGFEERIEGHDFVDDRTQDEDGTSDPVSAKNDARADNGETDESDES
jgi:hypothetical protein